MDWDSKDLTRGQMEIYEFLRNNEFKYPPTIEELCRAMGLSSKGSMHYQLKALIKAGLVKPADRKRRGIRLTNPSERTLSHSKTTEEGGTMNKELRRLLLDLGHERIGELIEKGANAQEFRTINEGVTALSEHTGKSVWTIRNNWMKTGVTGNAAMDIERDFDGKYDALKLAGKE